MAVKVSELRTWLKGQYGDFLIGVDEGGLSLVVVTERPTNAELIAANRGDGIAEFEIGGVPDPTPTVDPSDWDAPACLRYLAEHVPGPHHYRERAYDWDGEVARFAKYEGVTEDEWNGPATDELRAAVERVSAGLSVK